MKLRHLFPSFLISGVIGVFMIAGMASCSQKAEQVAAMETADQMEAANEGRAAARAIITREWTDTMRLQEAILEARAANSKYELAGKPECQASFDTAFFHTIRTVRPDLAKALNKKSDSDSDSE